MTLNLRRPFTALIAALILGVINPIAWAQHGEYQHQMKATEQSKEPAGDPYPLDIDPVSEDKLPDLDQQIIIKHEGRELRFGSKESVEAFQEDTDKYLAAIDELIVKQQLPYYPLDTCIISGDKLGGDMGEAINYVYKNRLVRFCCPGCSGDFNDNAAAYLKVLDEAVISAQKADYPLQSCPVSGGQLGAMGDPIDVVIANRLVRLCCKDCVKKLRADPVKYLNILGWEESEHDGHEAEAEHADGESGEGHSKQGSGDEAEGHEGSGHDHSGH